jgi:hypothetical protein
VVVILVFGNSATLYRFGLGDIVWVVEGLGPIPKEVERRVTLELTS